MENLYKQVRPVAKNAGDAVMYYFRIGAKIEKKEDGSYLTSADKAAHDILKKGLLDILDITFVSEEGKTIDIKQKQGMYRLVDPIDGTQSFVKRNGDFNINIALMHNHKPIFSLIYDPIREAFYSAEKGKGSFKEQDGNMTPLIVGGLQDNSFRFINSFPESYKNIKNMLLKEYPSIEEQRVFSAYKYCLMAEDKGDLFMQNRTTHHRDTAAGELLATQAGLQVLSTNNGIITEGIHYNTPSTINNSYIVTKPGILSQDIIDTFLLSPTRKK